MNFLSILALLLGLGGSIVGKMETDQARAKMKADITKDVLKSLSKKD